MTVARILAVKGRDVVTTQPHRTLEEVSRLLAERQIGAVVVTGADGDVLGIASERDIVRGIARGGASALQDAVSRHMTARVTTTTREATVDALMGIMTAGRFRHVPVVENGHLAGLVSIGDVVKSRMEELKAERQQLQAYITQGG